MSHPYLLHMFNPTKSTISSASPRTLTSEIGATMGAATSAFFGRPADGL